MFIFYFLLVACSRHVVASARCSRGKRVFLIGLNLRGKIVLEFCPLLKRLYCHASRKLRMIRVILDFHLEIKYIFKNNNTLL